MDICRRVILFAALVLSMLASAFALASLLTDYWFETDSIIRVNWFHQNQNHSNLKADEDDSNRTWRNGSSSGEKAHGVGSMHSGLFHGSRKLKAKNQLHSNEYSSTSAATNFTGYPYIHSFWRKKA